jgi:hypothetical protein
MQKVLYFDKSICMRRMKIIKQFDLFVQTALVKVCDKTNAEK